MTALGWLLAAGLAAGSPAGEGDPARALFAEANRAYTQAEFQKAVELYGALLSEHEIEDPAVYLNLGNACFKTGAYGSAVLYYRRALRLEPEAPIQRRLHASLETTRRVLRERYRASPEELMIDLDPDDFTYRLTHWFDAGPLAIGFLAAWAVCFGLLGLRRVRAQGLWNRAAIVSSGLVAVTAGLLLWGQRYTDAEHRFGVVVEQAARLHYGRHRDAAGVALPEGMELRITASGPEWTEVELADGTNGWVPSPTVKQI
jgi:tetratricopeptide (TPR) repeat protein